MTVIEDNGEIKVENNRCKQGAGFALKEIADPERTLTTTVRVQNGMLPLVSVRGDRPVKKDELKNLVRYIDMVKITAPVTSGQVILSDAGKNRVNIIATRNIETVH
jgi:CxxC motif-containing protein